MIAAVVSGIGDTVATTMLDGSMLLALPVAVVAGLVSFASPCVLPLVPGYLGYVSGMVGTALRPTAPVAADDAETSDAGGAVTTGAAQPAGAGVGATRAAVSAPGRTTRTATRGRTLLGVALFVAGFTTVFVTFAIGVASAGAALVEQRDVIMRALGVVVIVMGLVFIGRLPFAQRTARLPIAPRTGLWGAPLLGVVFGLGWTPCISPTLLAVYTLGMDEASAARGAALAVAYCVGLGLPFLLLALGFERGARGLGFLRRHRLAIMRAGGAVLVLLGIALVTGLWWTVTGWMQGWISGYELVV